MVKNMNEEELYKLRSKVFHKLLEFDEEDQCRGQMALASGCGKDEEIFAKLWEYLNDEKTSKTRNDIAEFILEFDDEFQNRVSNNINNDKE